MSATDLSESKPGAPTRHPLRWEDPEFTDPEALHAEMARVFDICHGCRRCVNLCQSFPTLFDLIDESKTLEVDGVDPKDFQKVVDQCYLCDLCFMTKCPYVPPHEWNVDFPHLMLRAKHARFKAQPVRFRDRMLSAPDRMGRFFGIPIVAQAVNAINRNPMARTLLGQSVGIHRDALIPAVQPRSARKRLKKLKLAEPIVERKPDSDGQTHKLLLFTTCYGNHNQPELVEDMACVFGHNKVQVRILGKEHCCGMPKMELGDLESVRHLMMLNLPELLSAIAQGFDITAPIPSCVLMFKQELPLLFPESEDVKKVARHFYDPFEYLMMLHKKNRLKTDFAEPLGHVVMHAACHQRVQNIGHKTRDILKLVPDTTLTVIERCSGHDGTYAVKCETHAFARKICQPIAQRLNELKPDHYGSDCPLAGNHIGHCTGNGMPAEHPIQLLRKAYGI